MELFWHRVFHCMQFVPDIKELLYTMKINKIFSKKNISSIVCIISCAAMAFVSFLATDHNGTQAVAKAKSPENNETSVYVAQLELLNTQAIAESSEEILEPAPQNVYALYIDDKMIAVTATEDEISSVLDEIKAEALKEYSDKKASADFTQNVQIKEGIYDQEPITVDELSEILSTPVEEEVTYTIVKGDSPYSICYKYDLTLDEFAELNGDNFDDYMYPDVEVTVKEQTNLLTVEVTVEETYTETVPFETETTYDENDYADNKTVTQKGVSGLTQYVDAVSYIDGKETSRTTVSETVISKPVTEKVTVGTIEHHYGYASGTFLWPVPNYTTITSTFGPRWGTNHNGLDISGSGVYGADIIASDGGTVTLAQSDNSGYGMHIIIDHGNGFETHYAHCSELYVSAGEQVYAGQVIAAVGSTGYSTGPHLHFEIIYNGTKIDPQQYV